MTPGASALHTPELVPAQGPQKTPVAREDSPGTTGRKQLPDPCPWEVG